MGITFLTKYLGTVWTLISVGTLLKLYEQTEYNDVEIKLWLMAAAGVVIGVGIFRSEKAIRAKLAERAAAETAA